MLIVVDVSRITILTDILIWSNNTKQKPVSIFKKILKIPKR